MKYRAKGKVSQRGVACRFVDFKQGHGDYFLNPNFPLDLKGTFEISFF